MKESSVHTAWLGLGSNLGKRRENISKACEYITNNQDLILKKSSIYKSPPWGFESQNSFYNMCVRIETRKSPEALLKSLQDIEMKMGRERAEEYIDRIIDIDILFYDRLVIESPVIRIPHPGISERLFVLEPMLEIDPELIHPISGFSIEAMRKNCPDEGRLVRLV